MLKTIVSGFQTGADIAGADAAISCNFPYMGWIPKGRRTEDGPLDKKYDAWEMVTVGYPKRTEKNIMASDGTVIFTHGKLTGGSALARKLAARHKKSCLHLNMLTHSKTDAVHTLLAWIAKNNIEALNVAGRSASQDDRIYAVVFEVICDLLNNERTQTLSFQA